MITRLLSAVVVVVRSFFQDLFGFVFVFNLRTKIQSYLKKIIDNKLKGNR